MAEALFWISAALIFYAYFGYPLLVLMWPRKREVARRRTTPAISFVIGARNEQDRIDAKIRHLLEHYPESSREVIVVSDGSTDQTSACLEAWSGQPGVKTFHYEEHRGKAFAIQLGVSHATGEIIIFTDTRQRLEPGAVEKLLENFADCNVGCVSGELHFETEGTPGLKATMYWKYERWLRHEESRIGCCMGATGAFYAIRRTLFRPLPDGLILDDVFTPLQIALQGYRVIHDARAVVWDVEAKDETQEFRRKVRTLMGNYQLLKYLPGLLRPGKIGFQFFSHKTIRLLAPLFLVTAFVSNWFLQGAFYRAALVAQCAFYLAAALGPLVPRGWPQVMGIPRAFVVLNSAALLAMINYFRGKSAVWKN